MKSTILALAALASAAPAPTYPLDNNNAPGFHCPINGTLPPNYVKPSLMVPVSAKQPNKAFGATQTPQMTPGDVCTIFNLDIPPSAADKICQLVFMFPDHAQAPRAPFVYFGEGSFNLTGYAPGVGATPETTYAHQPESGPSPPSPPNGMRPGNTYIINTAPCGLPAGLKDPWTVSGMLCSKDTTFSYWQSEEECPLGFFIKLLDQ